MKTKSGKLFSIYISFALLFLIIASSVFLFSCGRDLGANENNSSENTGTTVIELEGKQLIEVTAASGGYFPESIDAKASVPAVLRIKSENAYGCERAFRLPQLRLGTTLPINGTTDIEIGSFEPGTRIIGTCSMGMYSFVINFN